MVRLRNVGLTRAYRRNLAEAASSLERRVRRGGHILSRSTPSPQADRWLERAVEEAHCEGERLYWVTLGLLGVQRSLHLSGSCLRGAWRAVQGWRSLRPVRSRVPITLWSLEGAVLAWLWLGWREEGWMRRQYWTCAMASWLAFWCLLRPSEILNLRVSDLSFPQGGEALRDPGIVVMVRSPKTRRIWHRQFVLCSEPRVCRWLRWWVADKKHTSKIFPGTRYLWDKHFKEGLRFLELEACSYTLGSMRAGGATHHFRVHSNLSVLQFHGRWSSASTLQFYLQEAFSTHITSQLKPSTLEKLTMLHNFDHMLNTPPQFSLKSLLGVGAHAW